MTYWGSDKLQLNVKGGGISRNKLVQLNYGITNQIIRFSIHKFMYSSTEYDGEHKQQWNSRHIPKKINNRKIGNYRKTG